MKSNIPEQERGYFLRQTGRGQAAALKAALRIHGADELVVALQAEADAAADVFDKAFPKIAADVTLTDAGKAKAKREVCQKALSRAATYFSKKLAGIEDATKAAQKALVAADAPVAEVRISELAGRLSSLTVAQLRSLHASASPADQRVIEALGKIPTIGPSGNAFWTEVIPPADVEQARRARVAVSCPEVVDKIDELNSIREGVSAVGGPIERLLSAAMPENPEPESAPRPVTLIDGVPFEAK